MKRALPLLLWIAAAACGRAPEPAPHAGPNVLFLLVDTLRADRLGAYGGERGLTPNLDELAEESLRFSDCWATSSWTLPSVTTLLTANHGPQHGAWLEDVRLGEELDTLPELFREAGYRTLAVTGGGWVRRRFGLDRGFDVFEEAVVDVAEATRTARAMLDGVPEGRPWLLFFHTYQVHAPYRPPEEAFERVLAEHPGVLGDREPDPLAFRDAVRENGGRVPAPDAALLADLYDEEVRYTDRVLGAFLDELEAAGRLEDTVVVLTSDHGEEFGEHGLLGHSDALYVEQLHVPFLLRLPGGRRAGETDARRVSQLDLAPTVVDAAGLGGVLAASTFAGRSLLADADPSPVYATRNHEETGLLQALRRGPWVWIDGAYRWERAASGPELYDLGSDPEQRSNRAAEEPQRGGELRRELQEVHARYGELRASSHPVEVGGDLAKELEALGYRE